MRPHTRREIVETGAQGLLGSFALGAALPLRAGAGAGEAAMPGVITLAQTGAAGNGKTDDTAAIAEAIRRTSVLPRGGIVYAPPGVYRTSGGHVLDPYVQLVGAGVGSTVFRHVGNNSCFILTAPGVTEQRIGIGECSILGNGGASAVGVEFRDVSFGAWARLVRVRDYRSGAAFLLHNNGKGQFTEGVTLTGCSASNNAVGVQFRRTGGTNSFKGFYCEQFGCNVPASGTGFDFGVGGELEIVVYNACFHGHIWFNRNARNVGWDVGAKAILRDGQVWMSGEGSSPTSLSIRNRSGGRVTLFGQWWFGQIARDVDRRRTAIGSLSGANLT